jgi:hypothetical protein
MSEFIRIYQQRQGVRVRIRKLRRKRFDRDDLLRLKDEEKQLGEQLDKIIKDQKNEH